MTDPETDQTPLPQEVAERLPEFLDDYHVRREIGRGAMGVVYEAWQVSRGRVVALKVLPTHSEQTHGDRIRFRRECMLAACLSHPGLLRVLAAGCKENVHFFAMELFPGVPLKAVITGLRRMPLNSLAGRTVGRVVGGLVRKSRFDVVDARGPENPWGGSHVAAVTRLVKQVAEVLVEVHRAEILHRDIKPGNLLVSAAGKVKLIDFGLARRRGLPFLTRRGEFPGTPYYASPEQALARHEELDQRTDLWSLGATWYRLLTLRYPFPGRTTREVLLKIVDQDVRDPRKLNGAIPAPLAGLVLECLARDPERRPKNAAELVARIEALRLDPASEPKVPPLKSSVSDRIGDFWCPPAWP